MKDSTPFKIEGVIQKYAWGGFEYLQQLTRRDKPGIHEPWAELWLGAHPKGPSVTPYGRLDDLIECNAESILGPAAAKDWNRRLPYLLKILDVREMLSIQAHPTKSAAEVGFANEEANGPARTAANRNYRDDNHKPELGLALTDFYLLHGFKTPEAIRRSLEEVKGWSNLIPVFESKGVKGLYAHVMNAEQQQVNDWLKSLTNEVSGQVFSDKSKPAFWSNRAFQQYTVDQQYDRGIFSIYWFNLVHLRPGEAIFQDAGIPHAYLEGACVELMANSDNVLRGGLTVKHIDVPELMKTLSFDPVYPKIILPSATASDWSVYPSPVDDFELSSRLFLKHDVADETTQQATIYLLLSGKCQTTAGVLNPGEAVFQPAGTLLKLEGLAAESQVYRARAKQV